MLFKEKWVCLMRVALVEVSSFPPGWGNPKRQWPIQVNKGIRKPAATEAVLASYPVRKGPLSNLLPSMTAVLY